ncbi:MAG: hypothetical protein H5T73_09645 [Actinobacteria bacterium]|nr:hypothetical protein [Actinomycetota bacterium]
MEGKRVEIDGIVYNLEDPEQRKAAIRAWLVEKARDRSGDKEQAEEQAGGEDEPTREKEGLP